MLKVSGGCGHPPLHTGFRWPFRRGRCPHRPAAPAGAESPTSLCVGGGAKRRRERRAGQSRPPLQSSTAPAPCFYPVIPRQSAALAWESAPPTSLREGGVTAKGRDGGRDGRTEPRLYARLPRAYVLNVSGGCGHPPLHTGFRRPFRRGRCPHRPAAPAGAEPPTSLREGGVTAKGRDGGRDGRTESSAPTIVYRTCALLLPCHSEPVTDVTGVGIRIPRPLPLPLGEVAERSEDGEGNQ